MSQALLHTKFGRKCSRPLSAQTDAPSGNQRHSSGPRQKSPGIKPIDYIAKALSMKVLKPAFPLILKKKTKIIPATTLSERSSPTLSPATEGRLSLNGGQRRGLAKLGRQAQFARSLVRCAPCASTNPGAHPHDPSPFRLLSMLLQPLFPEWWRGEDQGRTTGAHSEGSER